MTSSILYEPYSGSCESDKAKTLVFEAVDLLASQFGVNKIEKQTLPGVYEIVNQSFRPFYDGFNNHIYLPDNADKGDYVIGHEVGHWFHNNFNRETYKYTHLYTESLAIAASLVYAGELEPELPFSLVALIRMNKDEIGSNNDILDEFFKEQVAKGIYDKPTRK